MRGGGWEGGDWGVKLEGENNSGWEGGWEGGESVGEKLGGRVGGGE